MRRAPLYAALLLVTACRQQVVVYECPDAEAHPDAAPAADAGFADAGPTDAAQADGGPGDAGEIDAGACDPFCFTGLDVSADTIDVREPVTFTPQVEAAPGVQWTVAVDDLVFERPAGRPALVPTEVTFELTSTDTDATFVMRSVPPWFFETTARVTVHVREVGRAVEQSLTATVVVRGNTLMATGAEGHVYAVASDGRPATDGGGSPDGALLDQLVVTPRAMRLSSAGELLVVDEGASPARILRVALTGKDVLLGELEYLDGDSAPILRSGASTVYGFTELPDGRVVMPEYAFAGASSAPKSRLLVWGADGQFEREVWAPSPNEDWRSVDTTPDGDLVVADRDADVLTRVDPSTWLLDGLFLDVLPDTPFTLHSTPDALYVGGIGYILEVAWGGGRAAVGGLPGSSSSWRALAGLGDGRLLAARDLQSSTNNLALIEGRQFDRYFREDGGPVLQVWGLVYLR